MPVGAIPFPFGICRICKDRATGVHYGVATCEGCKGFFKRTITRGDKYKCFFGSSCDVNPNNRNRCKSCRFRKCLAVGMSVEGVRMGRIPKAEKERALEVFEKGGSDFKNLELQIEQTGTGSYDFKINSHTAKDVSAACNQTVFGNSNLKDGNPQSNIENQSRECVQTGLKVSPEAGSSFYNPVTCTKQEEQSLNYNASCVSTGAPGVCSRKDDVFSGSGRCYNPNSRNQNRDLEVNTAFKEQTGCKPLHKVSSETYSSFNDLNLCEDSYPCPVGQGNIPALDKQRSASFDEDFVFQGDSHSESFPESFVATSSALHSWNNAASQSRPVEVPVKQSMFYTHDDPLEDGSQAYERFHSSHLQTCYTSSSLPANINHSHIPSFPSMAECIKGNRTQSSFGQNRYFPQDILLKSGFPMNESAKEAYHKQCSLKNDYLHNIESGKNIMDPKTVWTTSIPQTTEIGKNMVNPKTCWTTSVPQTTESGKNMMDPKTVWTTSVTETTELGKNMVNPKTCWTTSVPQTTESGKNIRDPATVQTPWDPHINDCTLWTKSEKHKTLWTETSQHKNDSVKNVMNSKVWITDPGLDFQSKSQGTGQLPTPNSSSKNWTYDYQRSEPFSCSPPPSVISDGSSSSSKRSDYSPAIIQFLLDQVMESNQVSTIVEKLKHRFEKNKVDGVLMHKVLCLLQNSSKHSSHKGRSRSESFDLSSLPENKLEVINRFLFSSSDSDITNCGAPLPKKKRSVLRSELSDPCERLEIANSMDTSMSALASEYSFSGASGSSRKRDLGEHSVVTMTTEDGGAVPGVDRKSETNKWVTDSSQNLVTSSELIDVDDSKENEILKTLETMELAVKILNRFKPEHRDKIRLYKQGKLHLKVLTESDEDCKIIYEKLMDGISGLNDRILGFCDNVPGFLDICKEDQQKLVKRYYYDMWTLSYAEYFQDGKSYWILQSGHIYSAAAMRKILNDEIVNTIMTFSDKFNALNLSDLEIGLFGAVRLTQTDCVQLTDAAFVDAIHTHMLDCLNYEMQKNHPGNYIRLLMELFSLVPLIDNVNRIQSEIIANFSVKRFDKENSTTDNKSPDNTAATQKCSS